MSWITDSLTDTEEATGTVEWDYLREEPMLVGDAVSDEEWAALSSMREDSDSEDPFYDEEGPYFGEDDDHRDPVESSLYRGAL